jgi:serine/threonine protein kinase
MHGHGSCVPEVRTVTPTPSMSPSPNATEEAKKRAASLVGTTLDSRYRIDDVLAMGAMGSVYLARHLRLKKRVALKILHPDVEGHAELVARFEREAEAGARVVHPHVAAATDFGELPDGTRYLVMEYVRGTTLRGVLDTQAPLAPLRAVRVARQIALALGEIHARGIVHRDLKPRNVMLSTDDYVKIVDFGLSKVDQRRDSSHDGGLDDDEPGSGRITGRGIVFGTVDYMAPESAFGMELVDSRADLYALGVIFYEMLAGKHPFDGETNIEVWTKMRHEAIPRFRERAPEISVDERLEAVVRKLLEKDFDDRFQTAAAFVEALDDAEPAGRESPAEPRELMRSVPPSSANHPLSVTGSGNHPLSITGSGITTGGSSNERIDGRTTASAMLSSVPKPNDAPPRKSYFVWIVAAVLVGTGALIFASAGEDPKDAARSVVRPEPPPPRALATPSPVPAIVDAPLVAPSQEAAPAPTPSPSASEASAIPSAFPSASGAPSASAAVVPPLPPGAPKNVEDLRRRLRKSTNDGNWEDAANATMALLSADQDAMEDPDAERTIGELLQALDRAGHPRTAELWKAVALSRGGADLLYRFAESGGKSPWAQRARVLLRDKQVLRSATPAVRVAWALRDAGCSEKLTLLDRAVKEGDERALVALQIAKACFKKSHSVDEASKKLRLRLEKEAKAKKAGP